MLARLFRSWTIVQWLWSYCASVLEHASSTSAGMPVEACMQAGMPDGIQSAKSLPTLIPTCTAVPKLTRHLNVQAMRKVEAKNALENYAYQLRNTIHDEKVSHLDHSLAVIAHMLRTVSRMSLRRPGRAPLRLEYMISVVNFRSHEEASHPCVRLAYLQNDARHFPVRVCCLDLLSSTQSLLQGKGRKQNHGA